MDNSNEYNRILIVDRQDYWRGLSAQTLAQKGYFVRTLGGYDYTPGSAYFDGEPPDLVILGCAKIGDEEKEFISKVRHDRRPVIVLSTSLPWADMRSLFLSGANDVADKTYDPQHIINLVEEAFENAAYRLKGKHSIGKP